MPTKSKAYSKNFPFESNYIINKNHKYTKICDDMIESKAWQDLSMRARGLYLELKKKFVSKNGGTETNQNDISIVYDDYYKKVYSKNTLFKDVDELIEHGFIKVVKHGKLARLPNIYGFDVMWKKYGTKDFFIHPNNKRLTKANSYTEDN